MSAANPIREGRHGSGQRQGVDMGRFTRGARLALLTIACAVATIGTAAGAGAAWADSPALPTWGSSYDWAGGDGYAGWHRQLLTADDQAYRLEAGLGSQTGLWLWPQG